MVTDDFPPVVLEGLRAAVDVWEVLLDSGDHYLTTSALMMVSPFQSAAWA